MSKQIKMYQSLNWGKTVLRRAIPGICVGVIGLSVLGCSETIPNLENFMKPSKSVSIQSEASHQIKVSYDQSKKEYYQEPMPEEVKLDVEVIMQNPELPNGCEITSATIILQYLGYDVSKLTMADRYLDQSSHWQGTNPEEMYMGNPRYSTGPNCGWYCLAGPIVEAVNEYLEEETAKTLGEDATVPYQAVDFTGISIVELKEQLAAGNPLVIWITMGPFNQPRYISQGYYNEQGEFVPYYTRLHCITVVGYTEDSYYLTDPIYGRYEISKEKFEDVWTKMGQRAVGILPIEQLEKESGKHLTNKL